MKTSRADQGSRTKPVRIAIIDGHPLTSKGLAAIIQNERDWSVCGEAAIRQQAQAVIAATQPDVVILDFTLNDSRGLELLKDIRVRHPKLCVLVICLRDESYYVERILRAGANGYLAKREVAAKIVQAIRQVLAGEVYLGEQIALQMAARLVGRPHRVNGHRMDDLSDRELQVFELAGQGFKPREIADDLRVSVSTVETHYARIKEKLGFKDAGELVRCAICWKQGEKF